MGFAISINPIGKNGQHKVYMYVRRKERKNERKKEREDIWRGVAN